MEIAHGRKSTLLSGNIFLHLRRISLKKIFFQFDISCSGAAATDCFFMPDSLGPILFLPVASKMAFLMLASSSHLSLTSYAFCTSYLVEGKRTQDV